jgi:L-aspartate oxidase
VDYLPKRETAVTSDYLIIGSGIAGLSFALKAASHGTVSVVTKDRLPESSSAYAQGGIASVWSPEDSFAAHIQDTLTAGAGLCHPEAVEAVVTEGPDRIRELIALGTRFSRKPGTEDQEYDLGLEGGHSHRRILHASDATGQEIMRALIAAVRKQPNIAIYENHLAVDLLVNGTFSSAFSVPSLVQAKHASPPRSGQACWGAYILNLKTNQVETFLSRITVLCTGGAGKVYLYTSNPDVASGDGVAMAYRAGVPIANMEFIQFHPTCLYHPRAKSFLISEALRGEGALLCLPDGTRFMARYHPRAELAPRDVVARAIDQEMKVHGFPHVYLDISHRDPEFLRQRFPVIYRRCREFGLDITTDPIPVVPAAHYLCGGVVTDLYGATPTPRLYAVGEVAMTGLHGANRLASNSLLEAVVFAHRAAAQAQAFLSEDQCLSPPFPPWNPGAAVNSDESVVVTHAWEEIRRLMWDYVGIVRSNRRLARARRHIGLIQDEIREYYWNFLITGDLLELRNLATVAELIITSASLRQESRGLHYNIDHPEHNDSLWQQDTVLIRTATGSPSPVMD